MTRDFILRTFFSDPRADAHVGYGELPSLHSSWSMLLTAVRKIKNIPPMSSVVLFELSSSRSVCSWRASAVRQWHQHGEMIEYPSKTLSNIPNPNLALQESRLPSHQRRRLSQSVLLCLLGILHTFPFGEFAQMATLKTAIAFCVLTANLETLAVNCEHHHGEMIVYHP